MDRNYYDDHEPNSHGPRFCSKRGCTSQAMIGEHRCENCWAEDQAKWHGKSQAVRFDKPERS